MNLFGHDLLALMASHGYLLLFVIIMLEEAGVPLPIPGDLLLLFAGSMVAQGLLGFAPTMIVIVFATLAGTSLLYAVGVRGGRPLLLRYGRWLRLKEDRVNRAERWLGKRPVTGVALLRLTPGLRIYSTLVAGLLAVPRRRATFSFVASGFVWAGAWVGLGVLLGPNVNRAANTISRLDGLFIPAIAAVVAAVALFWFGRYAYRRYLRGRIWTEPRVSRIANAVRRPRFTSATVSGIALAFLLVMPPMVGTLHTVGEHLEHGTQAVSVAPQAESVTVIKDQ